MIQLGIDIGGTSIKAAALQDGRPLWTGQSDFYSKPNTEALRAAIRAAAGGRAVKVDSIGVCAPGLWDAQRRVITYAINVPGIENIPIDRLIPDALNLDFNRQTRFCNDGQSTAIDIFESRKLTGRLLVMALGTGVGMAVLDDGVPLLVEGASPGHVGQIDVSLHEYPVIGPDGGAGGLEGYLGVAAMKKLYGSDLSAALEKFTGEEPSMLALVRAIRIVTAIYRPNDICLCGGIGIRLKHIIPALKSKVETHLTSLARPNWTLTAGDDDHHAARGAARLAARNK